MINKLFILLVLLPSIAWSLEQVPEDYAKFLQSKGQIKIPLNECQEMESKMGQIMYITGDGFDSNYTIHPDYDKLVKRIQPGGILPHYNSKNPKKIRNSNDILQKQSKLPLLIGIDQKTIKSSSETYTEFGQGTGSGVLGEFEEGSIECFEKLSLVDAALHKYIGLNNPLGPTIEFSKSGYGALGKDEVYKAPRIQKILDAFKQMGLETTLKHFPYTPQSFDLHNRNEDTKIPTKEVDEKFMPIFKRFSGSSGMVMTTHLLNSNIDPDYMATYSKKWINKLRTEVGFKGLVLTDALFMMSDYEDSIIHMAKNWPIDLQSDFSSNMMIFVVKAMMAGHDMIFIETSAGPTLNLWKDLVRLSCQDHPLSREFRKRVNNAYTRITNFKSENQNLKKLAPEYNQEIVDNLIKLRKDLKYLCEEVKLEDIKTLLDHLMTNPTQIDGDTFGCLDFSYLTMELDLLGEDLFKAFASEDIYQNLLSTYGEELNHLIGLLEKYPDKKDSLIKFAKDKLLSKEDEHKKNAAAILTLLEGWNGDNSYINMVIDSGDKKLLQHYLGLYQKGYLPYPKPEKVVNALGLLYPNPLSDKTLDQFFLDLNRLLSPTSNLPEKRPFKFKELDKLNLPDHIRMGIILKLYDESDFNLDTLGVKNMNILLSSLNKAISFDPRLGMRITFTTTATETNGGQVIRDRYGTSFFTYIANYWKREDIQKLKTDDLLQIKVKLDKKGYNPRCLNGIIIRNTQDPQLLEKYFISEIKDRREYFSTWEIEYYFASLVGYILIASEYGIEISDKMKQEFQKLYDDAINVGGDPNDQIPDWIGKAIGLKRN